MDSTTEIVANCRTMITDYVMDCVSREKHTEVLAQISQTMGTEPLVITDEQMSIFTEEQEKSKAEYSAHLSELQMENKRIADFLAK